MKNQLDATDLKILTELQQDGRMTNVELSSRVDISPPSCLRRMRQLEEEGYIIGYRALLDEKKLGLGIKFFIMVKTKTQAEDQLNDFAARVNAEPALRGGWMMSGDTDFILQGIATDITDFQSVVTRVVGWPQVETVKSSLMLKEIKAASTVPNEHLIP